MVGHGRDDGLNANVVAGRLQHELANYYDNDIILYFGLSEIKNVERKMLLSLNY